MQTELVTLPIQDDQFEPSSPNRWRFAIKLLIATTLGMFGFAHLDSKTLFPLPYFLVAMAVIVFPRNLQALVAPPYLRLSHQGIALRVWSHITLNKHEGDGAVIYGVLFAKLFCPIRKHLTMEIAWDQVTAIRPLKSAAKGLVYEHTTTIWYTDSDSRNQAVTFSRSLFSLTPQKLCIAIQQYRDLEFQWKPLRASGALSESVSNQQQRFREPVVIHYQPCRMTLWLGVFGIGGLSVSALAVMLKWISNDALFEPWMFLPNFACAIALLLGLEEMKDWVAIGDRRTVVLSAAGIAIGCSAESTRIFPWTEISSAKLRQELDLDIGGLPAGLDIGMSDGTSLFLPNSYDLSINELEWILTPTVQSARS